MVGLVLYLIATMAQVTTEVPGLVLSLFFALPQPGPIVHDSMALAVSFASTAVALALGVYVSARGGGLIGRAIDEHRAHPVAAGCCGDR